MGVNPDLVFVKLDQGLLRGILARPEIEPKTALGARLRDVRRQTGDMERAEFAARLGVSKSTIANYERGEAEPPASMLGIYRERLGINISWLVTGLGAMFDDPSKAPPHIVDPFLLEKLAKLASATYREAGIKLPGERITVEAAALYNELVARVSDLSDADEVEATLPQLRHRLMKRLSEAVAAPGAGKRSA